MRPICGFIILFLIVSLSAATSENIHVVGSINAWHDGLISDRTTGTGTIDYASEGGSWGRSSGLAVTSGLATFDFKAMDYSISLDDFQGEMVAESDATSTTIDGNGTGTMRAKSYDNGKPSSLSYGFPSGEINAKGIFEIHANSNHTILVDPMANNESDGLPVNETEPIKIDGRSEFPL